LLVRELGIGGCERDLTRIAVGLDRSRFEPHVASFRPDGLRTAELNAAAVPILHLRVESLISRAGLAAAWQMIRYIRRNNIQLVHALDVPMDIFAIPVAWAFRVAAISSQLSYRNDLYTRLERFLLPIIDWMSDRIVVNSRAVEKHLIETGIRADRLYVAHNGVDTRMFHPAPVVRPQRLRDASLVIGAVCALRAEKRLDVLVEAFAKVCRLRTGMKLAIVGSGSELAKLEGLSDRLGIRDACHFEPARTEVVSWMRSMDIFVLSSSLESFPNALLEAMACGCAPVGSRVGGVPELISHGENGLLFESGNVADLGDQLALLATDDARRHDLGLRACETARTKFSMEINLRRVERLYESVLERRGRLMMSPSSASE